MKTMDVIMDYLEINSFATAAQLSKICDVQAPAISKSLNKLTEKGFVCSEAFKPSIYRLTYRGGRYLGVTLPSGKRLPSASVQMNAAYKNEASFLLASLFPGFVFEDKEVLLTNGLRPAFCEYGGRDKSGQYFLILIDSYSMDSGRIARCWFRPHSPDANFYQGEAVMQWCNLVNRFIVICTSERQILKHKTTIARYNRKATLSASDLLPSIEFHLINEMWAS